MLDNPFYGPGGRRAIIPEVEEVIVRRTNTTPVNGFARMLDTGDADVGERDPFPYMETGDRRQWVLHLRSEKGMTWETDPIPEGCRPRVSFSFSSFDSVRSGVSLSVA